MKKLLLTFILLLFLPSITLVKAQIKKDYSKLHYLSEEEMNTPLNTKDFNPTPPPEGFIRNVAEFDLMQAVLVTYPFGIPINVIKEMADDIKVITIVANNTEKQTVINEYSNNGVNLDNCDFLISQTNSYWVRDYGPWFIFDGNKQAGIVDFPYNRPRPYDDDIPIKVANYLGINLYGMNVTHTGGNYMCDGMGQAASTDLVLDENNITEQEIKNKMQYYLGIENYHITNDPLQEYIKHIDCWGKFLAPDKILIGQVPENDWRYQDYEAAANYFANQTSSYGTPYKVYRVFTPGSPQDTPYTNSLILNNKVFIPITGSQWDDEALDSYEEAMPGYEIIGVQYWNWINTDALHCRTKGVADINQLYIWHVPVLSNVDFKESYNIFANLYNYSGEDIYEDSVFVIFKIGQSAYDTLLMTKSNIDPKYYSANITGAFPGDTVKYYIYAADKSGHRATHPFIGKPDPHIFIIKQYELLLDPDTLVFGDFDDIYNGVVMNIVNQSNNDVKIEYIKPFGENELFWYINEEDIPTLPYSLNAGDTLSLPVYYMIPVKDKWYYDSLNIVTPAKTYYEIIKVDSVIATISKANENKKITLKTYPNPFMETVIFNWQKTSDYTLQIYDISGKIVFNKTGYDNIVTWRSTNLPEGIYLYIIKIDKKIKTGKLFKTR
jgi:agmatine/peptidylarginine deiminase